MKILLLGGHGRIGWELRRSLAPLGEVIAPDTGAPGPRAADFLQPAALAPWLRAVAPDVVVNAAGYTAVDRAETEPERVHVMNAEAPGVLARTAAELGAWFVHYSSDYVFDGAGNRPYAEDAATAPLSAYGRSKVEGEARIRACGGRHLILRSSWIHAARGANFAQTVLRLAAERDTLDVVDDQIGAPTGADLVADVTAHALRRALAQPSLAGTYHCAAAGATSRHAYACFVIERALAAGRPLRLAPAAVRAVASRDFPTPARRPLNSRLDTGRLRRAFDLHLPPWEAGVERLLAEVLAC